MEILLVREKKSEQFDLFGPFLLFNWAWSKLSQDTVTVDA